MTDTFCFSTVEHTDKADQRCYHIQDGCGHIDEGHGTQCKERMVACLPRIPEETSVSIPLYM